MFVWREGPVHPWRDAVADKSPFVERFMFVGLPDCPRVHPCTAGPGNRHPSGAVPGTRLVRAAGCGEYKTHEAAFGGAAPVKPESGICLPYGKDLFTTAAPPNAALGYCYELPGCVECVVARQVTKLNRGSAP